MVQYRLGDQTYQYRRLARVEVPKQLRFLTFSCYQRLPLFQNDRIKDAFAERLEFSRRELGFRLKAWVIMPEHVHLMLAPPPSCTVRHFLSHLKGVFAQRVIHRWRELEAPVLGKIRGPDGRYHFWQEGGGYDRNIFTDTERNEKLLYIHENPVRRGLSTTSTDWAWSSARWHAGERSSPPFLDS